MIILISTCNSGSDWWYIEEFLRQFLTKLYTSIILINKKKREKRKKKANTSGEVKKFESFYLDLKFKRKIRN